MTPSWTLLRVLLATALAGTACSGNIMGERGSAPGGGGPRPIDPGQMIDPGTGKPVDPGMPMMPGKDPGATGGTGGGTVSDGPGVAPVRRLTRLEYNNTIRDLLGDGSRPGDRFPGDQESAGSGFLKGGAVSEVDAQVLYDTSQALATTAMGKLGTLLPCAGATVAAAQEDCAKTFIASFGRRAFRRPLTPDESTGLLDLYRQQRGAEVGADFPNAVRVVLEALLLSPSFLYHWELGSQAALRDGTLVKYNQHELAARLSYLIWASMPDETLFAAADAGQLGTPEQLGAQARRLLKSDKAKDAVADFYLQLLGIGGTLDVQKDVAVYPAFGKAMAQSMLTETREFTSFVLGPSGDGKLQTLLTGTTTFADETLSKLYGLQPPVTGAAFKQVQLDPAQRAGILTQANFLTVLANTYETHPVRRGVMVMEQVLCQELPQPPPNVPEPKQAQDGVSTRQRYSEHENNACAKNCHARFDPVGFAFENYDGIGQWRTKDWGVDVDASGTVELESGTSKTFKNALELLPTLASDTSVRDCATRMWLRYMLRRREVPGDTPAFTAANGVFAAKGYDLRELIVALVQTQSFTHRTPAKGEVLQ